MSADDINIAIKQYDLQVKLTGIMGPTGPRGLQGETGPRGLPGITGTSSLTDLSIDAGTGHSFGDIEFSVNDELDLQIAFPDEYGHHTYLDDDQYRAYPFRSGRGVAVDPTTGLVSYRTTAGGSDYSRFAVRSVHNGAFSPVLNRQIGSPRSLVSVNLALRAPDPSRDDHGYTYVDPFGFPQVYGHYAQSIFIQDESGGYRYSSGGFEMAGLNVLATIAPNVRTHMVGSDTDTGFAAAGVFTANHAGYNVAHGRTVPNPPPGQGTLAALEASVTSFGKDSYWITQYSGIGAPSNSLGIIWDLYHRLDTSQVYRKTGATTWTLSPGVAFDSTPDKFVTTWGAEFGKSNWSNDPTSNSLEKNPDSIEATVNYLGNSRGPVKATAWMRMGSVPSGGGWYFGHFMRHANIFMRWQDPNTTDGPAIGIHMPNDPDWDAIAQFANDTPMQFYNDPTQESNVTKVYDVLRVKTKSGEQRIIIGMPNPGDTPGGLGWDRIEMQHNVWLKGNRLTGLAFPIGTGHAARWDDAPVGLLAKRGQLITASAPNVPELLDIGPNGAVLTVQAGTPGLMAWTLPNDAKPAFDTGMIVPDSLTDLSIALTSQRTYFTRFVAPKAMTIKNIAFYLTSPSTGNDQICVGIYYVDNSGGSPILRLVNSNATSGSVSGKLGPSGNISANTVQTVALPGSGVTLQKGVVYYVAFAMGTISGSSAQVSGAQFLASTLMGATLPNMVQARTGGIFPLPVTQVVSLIATQVPTLALLT